ARVRATSLYCAATPGARSVGGRTRTWPERMACATRKNVCGAIVTWLPAIGNRKRMRATLGPSSTDRTLVVSDMRSLSFAADLGDCRPARLAQQGGEFPMRCAGETCVGSRFPPVQPLAKYLRERTGTFAGHRSAPCDAQDLGNRDGSSGGRRLLLGYAVRE